MSVESTALAMVMKVIGQTGSSKADLVDGKVPSTQLPSYVDDTIEGYYYDSKFYEDAQHTTEITGEAGKIYVDVSSNKSYRWTGSVYTRIDECPAFGETQGTIYEGNKGKANADAIAAIKDGTTIDSFADVETALAEKLNTSDIDATLSSTSTNPVQNKAVQAPIARLVDAGTKNLVKLKKTPSSTNTQISGSISNGVVTLSTSAAVSANSQVLITDGVFALEAGKKYKISGCPGNGTIRIFLRNSNGKFVAGQFGDAIEYTPQVSENYDLIIFLYSGINVSNFEIKPMLCTAENYAISPEFVPYAPSNRELYEMILALQNAQNGG